MENAEFKAASSTQPQAVQSASAERLLQEGLQAYRAHRLAPAVAKLRRAYQLASGNPKIRLTLGLMLYEKDPESLEAQRLMESVVPQFPDNAELHVKLLDSYLRLKNEPKWSSLLEHLQPTIANSPRLPFNVIYTLVRYGQVEPARIQLERISTRLQPKLQGLTESDLKASAHQVLMHEVGEVHFIRGMLAASQGEKAEAMRWFQAADRCDFPARDSLQMQMLAEALFRMEEYPLAIQAYETYLSHFPLDAAARMHLALGYYFKGSFGSAKEQFQKVAEEAPQTSDVHLYLGLTLLQQKSNAEARQQFQEQLKVEPRSYQAMAELAYLSYLDGDNERCRQWLEKARSLNPAWVETHKVDGLLYNRLGEFDRAVQSLEKVVKEKPADYQAHFQLSFAYRRLGHEAKAKEHAEIYDRLIAEERARQLGDRAPKN